jgi:hypothetical protein
MDNSSTCSNYSKLEETVLKRITFSWVSDEIARDSLGRLALTDLCSQGISSIEDSTRWKLSCCFYCSRFGIPTGLHLSGETTSLARLLRFTDSMMNVSENMVASTSGDIAATYSIISAWELWSMEGCSAFMAVSVQHLGL